MIESMPFSGIPHASSQLSLYYPFFSILYETSLPHGLPHLFCGALSQSLKVWGLTSEISAAIDDSSRSPPMFRGPFDLAVSL
jgi:hypothetical protein